MHVLLRCIKEDELFDSKLIYYQKLHSADCYKRCYNAVSFNILKLKGEVFEKTLIKTLWNGS